MTSNCVAYKAVVNIRKRLTKSNSMLKLKTVFKLENENRFHFLFKRLAGKHIFRSTGSMALEKTHYKTKQNEELISYLQSVPGEHVTVNDVCRHFCDCGKNIGTTTVYRRLEQLVSEGAVKKYVLDANSPACFEYINPEETCGNNCFHLKCTKCGKLIHLHCDELLSTEQHIFEHHGFLIDTARTVFYGLCENCRE